MQNTNEVFAALHLQQHKPMCKNLSAWQVPKLKAADRVRTFKDAMKLIKESASTPGTSAIYLGFGVILLDRYNYVIRLNHFFEDHKNRHVIIEAAKRHAADGVIFFHFEAEKRKLPTLDMLEYSIILKHELAALGIQLHNVISLFLDGYFNYRKEFPAFERL